MQTTPETSIPQLRDVGSTLAFARFAQAEACGSEVGQLVGQVVHLPLL